MKARTSIESPQRRHERVHLSEASVERGYSCERLLQQLGGLDMNGRVCIITGANSGIGRATALGLAEMGASVVKICRSRERGEEALAEVKAATGNPTIDLLSADLSSQAEVRRLARRAREKLSVETPVAIPPRRA